MTISRTISWTFHGQRIPISKRKVLPDQSQVDEQVAWCVGDLTIELSMRELVQTLGTKALRSRGGHARGKFITVKARKVRREEL